MAKAKKNNKSAKLDKILHKEDFELSEIDGKILRLSLDYEDLTDAKIGEIVGLTRQQVNSIKHKPIFKKVYNEYQKKAIDIIISAKTEAAIKLKKHIHSKNEKISQDTCKAILTDELKEKEAERKPIEVVFKFQ